MKNTHRINERSTVNTVDCWVSYFGNSTGLVSPIGIGLSYKS